MAEKDVKEGEEEAVVQPDPKIEELEKVNRQLLNDTKDTRSQLDRLSGQLDVITEAAKAPPQTVEDEELDIIGDPQGALDKLWKTRAAPLIRQQTAAQSNTQKELISVKRAEDWKLYEDHVNAMIAQGRITPETLAQPGAYDQLLDLAKSKDIDNIVAKKVEAQVAEFQSKSAMSGPGVATKTESRGGDETVELTDEEKFISTKLGVSEEKYTEASKNTTFDGVRIRGGVDH